jgi:hypothetical protein
VEQAGIHSYNAVRYCPSGTFLTGLDLDSNELFEEYSPEVGAAQCCAGSVGWDWCMWVGIGDHGLDSLSAIDFCPDGTYVTGLQLSSEHGWDEWTSPVVYQAECCRMAEAQYLKWGSCSWVGVDKAGIDSHARETWCPNGSFIVGFDLDADWNRDGKDSPVIGQAHCCTPGVVQREPG